MRPQKRDSRGILSILAGLVFVFFAGKGLASLGPEQLRLQDFISGEVDSLNKKSGWLALIKDHSAFSDDLKDRASVTKREVQVGGETYTLGVGYRQVFIHAPMAKVCEVLQSPGLFQDLFGLSQDAQIPQDSNASGFPKSPDTLTNSNSSKGCEQFSFKARITKKVPVVDDQDFVLAYDSAREGDFWFQRARPVEDHKKFALRDNLVVLTKVNEGTLLREVSYVYILRAMLRIFGPQVRSVTQGELEIISRAQKCAAEAHSLSKETLIDCSKKAAKN